MKTPAKHPRVLVVDDDHITRRLLQVNLERHGLVPVLASSAKAAIAEVETRGPGGFEVVITDYRMEGGDGLELLCWLQERDRTLATIIITGDHEKSLIAQSLRGGAHDFLEKPLNMGHLLASVSRAVENTRLQRRFREAESAVREISRVQHTLVAMHATGFEHRLEVCYFPRQQAGGDFSALFRLGGNRFVVLASDVSGHDLKAAFIASYFQGMFRGMMERGSRVEQAFDFFNRFLVDDWNRPGIWGQGSQTETSMAACSVCIDLDLQCVDVLDCGFPAPVHLLGDGRASVLTSGGSAPLGWFPDLPLTSRIFPTCNDGEVVLWSDGVEDLAGELAIDTQALVYRLRAAVRAGETEPECLVDAKDDVMALAIHLGGPPIQLVVHQIYAGDQVLDIDGFQAFWERSLTFALPDVGPRLMDILLCAREALLNALLHGCHRSHTQAASCTISVHDGGRVLRLRVSDPGPGHTFNVEAHEQASESELVEVHRGLILMKHLSDGLFTARNGAEVVMDFKL